MMSDYAFELKDLAALLGLEPTGPADHADVEAINTILNRRRAAHTSQPTEQGNGHRPTLHLVPDCPP
jgi:hypothetical protein